MSFEGQAAPRALRRLTILLALSAAAVASFPAAAGAVAPAAPAYKITSTISPTHLVPGDESGQAIYVVKITNSGGKATDGTPITVVDDLPPGITVDPDGTGFVNLELFDDPEANYPCEEGPPVVCTASLSLVPGGTLHLFVPIDVAPGVSNPAVNKATVSGGGAREASVQEVTPADGETHPPFGFQSISTALTDADGTPFTQAGGHPYSFVAHFQLNQFYEPTRFGSQPTRGSRDVVAKLPKGW